MDSRLRGNDIHGAIFTRARRGVHSPRDRQPVRRRWAKVHERPTHSRGSACGNQGTWSRETLLHSLGRWLGFGRCQRPSRSGRISNNSQPVAPPCTRGRPIPRGVATHPSVSKSALHAIRPSNSRGQIRRERQSRWTYSARLEAAILPPRQIQTRPLP